MATIKDRAEYYANKWLKRYYYKVHEAIEAALTEQDRIARAEERERCIKAAQDWYCRVMCVGRDNKKLCSGTEFCRSYKQLRIAIEEGGKG